MATFAVLLGVGAVGTTVADTRHAPATFAEMVAQHPLIVLADIEHPAAAAFVVHPTWTFKGVVGPELRYQDEPASAIDPSWTRAIVAFEDPRTLDFRASTIAWHVTVDGTVDPEHFQQRPGTPPTLEAWFAAFGRAPQAAASPARAVATDEARSDAVLGASAVVGMGVALVLVAGSVGLLVAIGRRRRAPIA